MLVALVLSHEFALPSDAFLLVLDVLSGQIDELFCSCGLVHQCQRP